MYSKRQCLQKTFTRAGGWGSTKTVSSVLSLVPLSLCRAFWQFYLNVVNFNHIVRNIADMVKPERQGCCLPSTSGDNCSRALIFVRGEAEVRISTPESCCHHDHTCHPSLFFNFECHQYKRAANVRISLPISEWKYELHRHVRPLNQLCTLQFLLCMHYIYVRKRQVYNS